MTDPYDTGTPKYSSANDIYEGLQTLAESEEMTLLSTIAEDVSWDNQDYIYYDKGYKLLQKFEKLTNRGDELWRVDLAVARIDGIDSNDWVYECLYNDDVAKRLGFKKIFVDKILDGNAKKYNAVATSFFERISELNRFEYGPMGVCLKEALDDNNIPAPFGSNYGDLGRALYDKIQGLRIDDEIAIVHEARALLTSYDDFIFGLRVNEQLYKAQEEQFNIIKARLEAEFKQKAALMADAYKSRLLMVLEAAENAGLMLQLPDEVLLINDTTQKNEEEITLND